MGGRDVAAAPGVAMPHCHVVPASDGDRAPKFYRVTACYGAAGVMGDLDDGAEQAPLADAAVQQAVLALLGEGQL